VKTLYTRNYEIISLKDYEFKILKGFQSTHLLVDRRCDIMRSRNDCSSIYNIQIKPFSWRRYS